MATDTTMDTDVDDTPKAISEVTRRAVIDHVSVAKVSWAGRLQDDEFLARLYDLSKLPSFDPRYQDAAGDIIPGLGHPVTIPSRKMIWPACG
jgi:hypothetical protein